MHVRKLAGLSAFLLCVCLDREARADCTTDVECKGDRICVEGACVDPPPKVVPPPAEATPVESSSASARIETKEARASDPPRMKRRSTGLFVTGIVSLSLVPVAGLVSFASWASKDMCEFDARADADQAAFVGRPPPPPANCSKHNAGIYGGLVGATVLLGGGLAMLLVGATKVPVERKDDVSVRPWLSPSAAGLGVSTSF